MTRLLVVLATAVVAASAASAAPPRASLHVRPAVVRPGAVLTVFGNAGDCHPGGAVTVISRAIRGQAFAGIGAISGRVEVGGAFSVRAPIRSKIKRGRYAVTARCGGGNLGVVAYVRIR